MPAATRVSRNGPNGASLSGLERTVEALRLVGVGLPGGDEEEEAHDDERDALGDVADPAGGHGPVAGVLAQVLEELLRPALVDVVAGDAEHDQADDGDEQPAAGAAHQARGEVLGLLLGGGVAPWPTLNVVHAKNR